jgi:hypothetical protein
MKMINFKNFEDLSPEDYSYFLAHGVIEHTSDNDNYYHSHSRTNEDDRRSHWTV